jgi:predicted Zn-dependent protease
MNVSRIWTNGLAVVVMLALHVFVAYGQEIRPPELSGQFYRAQTAWKSGVSVLEAKVRVDRVLRELPDDVAARKLRAQVLLAMDRPAEAVEDARRAVELDEADGEAYLILCEASRLFGDQAMAEYALDAAAERVLEDAGFHIRLSWNAALLNQLDKAEAFARIALALDGNEAAAYYQLARVFLQQSQPDDAAAVLARGLRNAVLDPGAIQRDTLLVQVADHVVLEGLLR